MPVSVTRFEILQGELPGEVRLVISDGLPKSESKVWISARFSLDKPSTDKLSKLTIEAIDQLQSIIEKGRANAAREPGAPKQ